MNVLGQVGASSSGAAAEVEEAGADWELQAGKQLLADEDLMADPQTSTKRQGGFVDKG